MKKILQFLFGIENLKTDLINGTVSERRFFWYLMLNTVFTIFFFSGNPVLSHLGVESILFNVLVFVPLILFYWWSQKYKVKSLVQNYLSLGFVIGNKFLLLGSIFIVTAFVIFIGFAKFSNVSTLFLLNVKSNFLKIFDGEMFNSTVYFCVTVYACYHLHDFAVKYHKSHSQD